MNPLLQLGMVVGAYLVARAVATRFRGRKADLRSAERFRGCCP